MALLATAHSVRRTGTVPLALMAALLGGISSVALAAGLPIIEGTGPLQKYTGLPATSVATAQPQAMITMSKDHQLFLRAYDDFTDLNNDGEVDTGYLHGFRYFGYFDDNKCYSHDGSRFKAVSPVDADRFCSGATWSGNFLNWATMTRADVVRKILFGGKRVVDRSVTLDGTAQTILERAYLPNDAHSFAKFYDGGQLARLTPFSEAQAPNGITICNTTMPDDRNVLSQDVTDPPLMRVAEGNFSLWAANERWQCLWREEENATNGNDPAITGLAAASRNPRRSDDALGDAEYAVRVEVCVPGLDSGDRCKRYPDGSLKPIGLLQEFGDNDRMWFGLSVGTYQKNKSGADVMKRVGTFTDEINTDVDGRFTAVFGLRDADGNVNGKQQDESFGLVNALSLYRIIEYRHSNGVYRDCTFRLAEFDDGECKNWGNPLAEAYLTSLRWYANEPPAGPFRANDSTFIEGLNPPASYQPPSINADNECASLNTVVFNTSNISYDGDQLDDPSNGLGTVNATLSSIELTNLIGAGEGIHGKDFFVGENGDTSAGDPEHQLCTAKTVDALGEVRGICPEGPRLEGTFRIAGAAYHAHTGDVNTKNQIPGEQSVKTYAVQLASGTPELKLRTPGGDQSVTLLPACLNIDLRTSSGTTISGRNGACAIVDFKHIRPPTLIEDPTAAQLGEADGCQLGAPSAIRSGRLYVNWENGEQGGDYDQDMWGLLDYRMSDDGLCVTTQVFGYSGGGARMGFGYALAGTTQDGVHYHSGAGDNGGFPFDDRTGATDCAGLCNQNDDATSHTYTLGGSAAGLLKPPLWYAAKWGGFDIDPDATGAGGRPIPLRQDQWDTENVRGEPEPDGDPDNFFFAVEPRQLEDSLRRVFAEIVGQVASGTAAAVVANAREGEGAVYQALFEPTRTDANGNEVRWIGALQSLWVDSKGRLREDNGDRQLGDFSEDPVVELFFDESASNVSEQRTRVRRFTGDPEDGNSVVVELDDLQPLWNARDLLAALPEVESHRSYSAPADRGRFIFTWLDKNLNGVVDGTAQLGDANDEDEVLRFLPENFGSGRAGILNAPTPEIAEVLVDYIRGNDKPALQLRNRTLDHDGDGQVETMRLGDIVNSTPTVVGAPAEAIDLLYDDETYAKFRRQYRNRRNVVYAGANDGMLHAFNAGFFNASESRFQESIAGRTAHPLGAELWAYIPFHLLPHLTWLTDTEYTHVWYVDGSPRVFDARIFPEDADHPGGWGTVLVVGMRLGGGDIALPLDVDCSPITNLGGLLGGVVGELICFIGDVVEATFGDFEIGQAVASLLRDKGGGKQEITLRSSYSVLDVTNPEKPPRVLGEIALPDMGFTTVAPAVVAHSQRGITDATQASDSWYLALGNGPDNIESLPNNISQAESTQSGKLWLVDLKAMVRDGAPEFLQGFDPAVLPDSVETTGGGKNARSIGSQISGITVADWDLDFKADGVYFGSISGQPDAPGGALWKLDMRPAGSRSGSANPQDWQGPERLLDTQRPVTSIPSLVFDQVGNWWVLGGTGRFFSDVDRASSADQALFGVIDGRGSGRTTTSNFDALLDVSAAQVTVDGKVSGVPDVETEAELEDAALEAGGWRLGLAVPGSAERVVTQTSVIGDIFFASAFTPSTSLCGAQGRSRLFGLNFTTGAASSRIPTFGTSGGSDDGSVPAEAVRDVDIGVGLGSAPSLFVGGARDQRGLTVFTQTSTGAIAQTEGLVSDSIRSGELDWRERE